VTHRNRGNTERSEDGVKAEIRAVGPVSADHEVFADADDERRQEQRKEPSVLTLGCRRRDRGRLRRPVPGGKARPSGTASLLGQGRRGRRRTSSWTAKSKSDTSSNRLGSAIVRRAMQSSHPPNLFAPPQTTCMPARAIGANNATCEPGSLLRSRRPGRRLFDLMLP
jgi:hypothetical protein